MMIEENMTFERAIKQLESIVSTLENGEVSLDESIRLFEEGMELSRFCSNKLNQAEGKITVLMKGQNGFFEIPFGQNEE